MKTRRFLVGVVALYVLGMAAGSSHARIDPGTIVGIWLFDEGGGGVARDSSQNGNDGTLLPSGNGPQWTTQGQFGGALEFNGAGAYIQFATGESMKTPHFTIMAWFNTRKLNGYGHIFQTGRDWDNMAGYVLRVHQGGTAQAGLAFGPGNTTTFVTGPALNANTWYHMALTFDGTTATLYLDGAVAATGAGQGEIMYDDQPVRIGVHSQDTGAAFDGFIDEVALFDVALGADDIQSIMDRGLAEIIGGVAVARTHDAYLGTAFADVNTASRASGKGVLASQGQAETTFDPASLFDFGQTYYWRIDEVNAAPDNTIFKGDIWSFTTEPYGYPVQPVAATASSSQAGMGPEKTIDGSGMTGDLHGTEPTTMWLSAGVQPNWIRYEFDQVYKLHELTVWNSNQLIESFMGFGAKSVTIETSTDGTTWTPLAGVPEFDRAAGAPGYAANTTVSLGGADAKYVRLTINRSWGGLAPQSGLAEVQFSYVPVQAREPKPATATTGVSIHATLNWRPGREATSHEIFFGTDRSEVADGTVAAQTVTEHSYVPASLDFGTTYYWKVNEIGTARTCAGDLWSFATQEYATIDDFESYTEQAGEEIFGAWVDGFTTGLSGSTVGHLTAARGTYGETTIVHGGNQSMPLQYDNTAAPFFSEAERTFTPAQDWTGNGADSLVLYFRGLAPAFAETASGGILMNAIGTDIWGTGDQFRYAYKSLSGDGTMVARVDSVFNSNVWAKAGVMIRQSTQPASVHAFMPITPGGSSAGNGASFQRRLTTGGASTNDDSTTRVAAPYWVKIERKGNNFSGYISPDGGTWTQLGTAQTIPMTNPVLIGLALCSHDAAIATSAAFSNISTTGNVTGSWQVAEIGATQPEGNSIEGLYLTVKDTSGKTKVVQHPDPAATAYMTWQEWTIPLSEFTSAGVKMTAVKSLTIGVGNQAAPKAGGTGTVYLDDIGFGHPAQ
jgi:hypothetical protein